MELIVLGAGRGAVELLDLVADVNDAAGLERFRPVGFLDDDAARHGARLEGLPILGPLADAGRFPAALFANAIGSPANHRHRDAIVARIGCPRSRRRATGSTSTATPRTRRSTAAGWRAGPVRPVARRSSPTTASRRSCGRTSIAYTSFASASARLPSTLATRIRRSAAH